MLPDTLYMVFIKPILLGIWYLSLSNASKTILEQAVDFKKPVYEQVLEVFSPYLLLDTDEEQSTVKEANWGEVGQ